MCDVKNKIDITSMQENIRQYNNLLKNVSRLKEQEKELQEIDDVYNSYIENTSKEREEQYLIWRAEKQKLLEELENLKNKVESKKREKINLEEETNALEENKNKLDEEIEKLKETRAKSDVEIKRKELNNVIDSEAKEINRIKDLENKSIQSFRNHSLKWNANILELEKIKNKIIAKETDELKEIKDLLKYLESINENNFNVLEIKAIEELRQKISGLIKLGNDVFYATKQEVENDRKIKQNLEDDIRKLEKGINPYEDELINFKLQLENNLKEKTSKNINISILADLLEIKNPKWQNAIEGYLNTQKKYLIIEPEFFEEASKIYREFAKKDNRIHSFGIVDIEKIQKENIVPNENSLATEIITENKLARVYINYLLGRVIKCETIGELRTNKIAITSDCMLYQGYVLRKINPSFYKYPIIGSNALEKQKQIKQEELEKIKGKILNEQSIIDIMENVKEMDNLSIGDILYFTDCIKESKEKEKHLKTRKKAQDELDGMDMFWLNNISQKIKQQEEVSVKIREKIIQNTRNIGILESDIKHDIEQEIPEKNNTLDSKIEQIDENYSKEWQENIGKEKYDVQALKRTPEKIIEVFLRNIKHTANQKEQIKQILVQKRSDYNTKYQYSYNIQDGSNKEFTEELKKLKEITLPEYTKKIEDSRKKAYEQFRIEFLDKLKSNIDEVKAQIKELFDKITVADINTAISDEEYEKNIKEYTDYRTYLNFDLIVKDKQGNEQRLSKTLLKKSGGETQTPFYISILASFAQVYRIKNDDNTARLIVFDEAFSKMDSERIEESIKLLRQIGFQAIFAAPPEKLQDIQKLVDSTLLVLNPKEHEIVVRKYTNKEEW